MSIDFTIFFARESADGGYNAKRIDKRGGMWYHRGVGKITEMSAQKRNKSRVNIFIDGEFACSLEAVTALECGLRAGVEIDPAKLAAVKEAGDGEAAFARAVARLSRRACTRKELERYLASKDFSPSVVTAALDKLAAYGYIDDAELADSYVAAYSDRRGKRRLKQDMSRRGLGDEDIERALSSVGDQRDAAYSAAEKYLRTRAFDARKLSAHLASKGFEWEDIAAVVRGLEKGEDET